MTMICGKLSLFRLIPSKKRFISVKKLRPVQNTHTREHPYVYMHVGRKRLWSTAPIHARTSPTDRPNQHATTGRLRWKQHLRQPNSQQRPTPTNSREPLRREHYCAVRLCLCSMLHQIRPAPKHRPIHHVYPYSTRRQQSRCMQILDQI
jgi:hypothetical protein